MACMNATDRKDTREHTMSQIGMKHMSQIRRTPSYVTDRNVTPTYHVTDTARSPKDETQNVH